MKTKGHRLRIIATALLLITMLMIALMIPFSVQAKSKKKNKDDKAAILPAAVKEQSSRSDQKDLLKSWIAGPVRYLSNIREESEFKRLKTDIERAWFISRFWLKRDCQKETLNNEFRNEFWSRVRYANEQFSVTTVPGWKTDRGKIYILLGPPNELQPSREMEPAGVDSMRNIHDGRRGVERWLYRDIRSNNPCIPDTAKSKTSWFYVVFEKLPSGEYELSSAPAFYEKGELGVKTDASERDPFAMMTPAEVASSISQNMIDEARAAIDISIDVVSGEEILQKVVTTLDQYEQLPNPPVVDYFLTGRGKTGVLLRTDLDLTAFYKGEIVGRKSLPLGIFGKAIAVGSMTAARAEYQFSTDIHGTRGVNYILREGYLARVMCYTELPPGAYELRGVVSELLGNRLLSFSMDIQVPDLELSPLKIMNLTLTNRIEDRPSTSVIPYNLDVTPDLDLGFDNHSTIGIYYQVYGLADGNNREPDFNASYQLYVLNNDRRLPAGGEPIALSNLHKAEQGWEFTESDKWPSGNYELQITITDNLSQMSDQASIAFRIQSPI